MREITLQPAYLLHSRPFRESSLLLDFITRDFGRVSAVARGARGPKSRHRGLLQPFTPLRVSLIGRHELKTLRGVETTSAAVMLTGARLFSALYINELMVRLIHGHEAEAGLYDLYQRALSELLAGREELEPVLRRFEIALLEALGYGIVFDAEAVSGARIQAGEHYWFHPDSGFTRINAQGVAENVPRNRESIFPGAKILKIAAGDFTAPETRTFAKRLLRQALAFHLGGRPLQSRQLFSGLHAL